MTRLGSETLLPRIRLFVSSTFHDMQAERDVLATQVFPELRKICIERGVDFKEVDLRWGITEKQIDEGRMLPICLTEIRNCLPFFLGILGERYGSSPGEIPRDLREREPWIAEVEGRSVTELEMMHGALNNPSRAVCAYFYFRDAAYVEQLPEDERERFVEVPSSEEIDRLGVQRAEMEAARRSNALVSLKDRIRTEAERSKIQLRTDYSTPKEFGELVLRDYKQVINGLFPTERMVDPRDRETEMHKVFSHAFREIFVPRPDDYEFLNEFAARGDPHLLVDGESGSGKTALLVNWSAAYVTSHPDVLLPFHFVGASESSGDWEVVLRRFIRQLKDHAGGYVEIPEEPDAIRKTFLRCLEAVSVVKRVILMIDGLDKLNPDAATRLDWLPESLPEGVSLILSTGPGEQRDYFRRIGWPCRTLGPLPPALKRKIVEESLSSYSRELMEDQIDLVVGADQTGNASFLRVLIEEMRLHGNYRTLSGHLADLLSAPSIHELYRKIITRYVRDYERDRPGLVGDALSLLATAHLGLTEFELLELLGSRGNTLAHALWAPLHLALGSHVVNIGGYLRFSERPFHDAVVSHFIETPETQRSVHRKLTEYFSNTLRSTHRRAEELPLHLLRSRTKVEQRELLCSPSFLADLSTHHPMEALKFWSALEAEEPAALRESFSKTMNKLDRLDTDEAWALARLFRDLRYHEAVVMVWDSLLDRIGETADERLAVMGNKAASLVSLGRFDDAAILFRESMAMPQGKHSTVSLRDLYINYASLLRESGKIDEALEYLEKSETLSKEIGDYGELAALLNNRAVFLSDHGRFEDALEVLGNAVRACNQAGGAMNLITCYENLASTLHAMGRFDESWEICERLSTLAGERHSNRGLISASQQKAMILKDRGHHAEGLRLLKEAEEKAIEIGDFRLELICQSYRSSILIEGRRFEEALKLLGEIEKRRIETGDRRGLLATYGKIALAQQELGNLDDAIEMHRKEEAICRELNSNKELQRCLGNLALVCHRLGNHEEALRILEGQEEFWRESGSLTVLSQCLGNQAAILLALDRDDEALRKMQQQEELCISLNLFQGLRQSLINQARLFHFRDALEEALKKLDRYEQLCMEIDDAMGLQESLEYRTRILIENGLYGRALDAAEAQEKVCRKLPYMPGFVNACANLAVILSNGFQRHREALAIAREALDLAHEHDCLKALTKLEELIHYLRDKAKE